MPAESEDRSPSLRRNVRWMWSMVFLQLRSSAPPSRFRASVACPQAPPVFVSLVCVSSRVEGEYRRKYEADALNAEDSLVCTLIELACLRHREAAAHNAPEEAAEVLFDERLELPVAPRQVALQVLAPGQQLLHRRFAVEVRQVRRRVELLAVRHHVGGRRRHVAAAERRTRAMPQLRLALP